MQCSECGYTMRSEKDNDRETFVCPGCGSKLIKQHLSGETSPSGNLAISTILSYYRGRPHIAFITVLVSIISFVVGLLVRNFWGLLIVVACIAVSLLIPPWRERIHEHRKINTGS